jgi:serine/threonine protein kinase
VLPASAPRRIGAYEIVAHLRSGGMATLYLGRRTGAAGFARHVAIKVVHAHLAENRAFVRMFLDEAFLSARITHPNVVHVEELGESEGAYFLVMEYVHGAALSQLLKALSARGRRLTPELAVWIAIQIADGLHAAHELCGDDGQPLQVVHRDVSPQNVLVSYAGHVKVIDFGIAKARSRAKETATGSLRGKLRYMAPEQGFGRDVDRRTDVYALGIVLWELLTVRRFFDADDDFALLDLVREPALVPASRFAEGVTPALDAVLARALAPRPEDRPATMQELRRLLAEAVPGALAVDAAHVAALLGAVMTDEIARQREILPESLSAIRVATSRAPAAGGDASSAGLALETAQRSAAERDEILRTLTYRAVQPTLHAEDGDVQEPAPAPTGTPIITHTEHLRAEPPRAVAPALRAAGLVGLALLFVGAGVGLTWAVRRARSGARAVPAIETFDVAPAVPPLEAVAPLPALAPTPDGLPAVTPLPAVAPPLDTLPPVTPLPLPAIAPLPPAAPIDAGAPPATRAPARVGRAPRLPAPAPAPAPTKHARPPSRRSTPLVEEADF